MIRQSLKNIYNKFLDVIGLPKGREYSFFYTPSTARESTEPDPRLFPREPVKGALYHDLANNCNDAVTAIESLKRDIFGSADSADNHNTFWLHHETEVDSGIPTDPWIYDFAIEFFSRKNESGEYVIGGRKLELAVENLMTTGDNFLEILMFQDKKYFKISDLIYLPPYEMFAVTSEQNQVLRYEQRRFLNEIDPIEIDKGKIIHTSYRRRAIYGRPIFTEQSLNAWAKLKKLEFEQLPRYADGMTSHRDVFSLPQGFETRRAEFESVWRDKKRAGQDDVIVLPQGAEYESVNESASNFLDFIKYANHLRLQIIPGGFPTWYFMGMDSLGALDIAGQPAVMYSRLRAHFCGILSGLIRHAMETEIVVNFGKEKLIDINRKGGYTIVFPEFVINPNPGGDLYKSELDDVENFA